MNVVGAFIEALARRQRHLVSTFHLHRDRTFQHVNTYLRIVPMDGARKARRKIYGIHENFPVGRFCERARYQRLDSLLRHQGAGCQTDQDQHPAWVQAESASVQIRVRGASEMVELLFHDCYLLQPILGLMWSKE